MGKCVGAYRVGIGIGSDYSTSGIDYLDKSYLIVGSYLDEVTCLDDVYAGVACRDVANAAAVVAGRKIIEAEGAFLCDGTALLDNFDAAEDIRVAGLEHIEFYFVILPAEERQVAEFGPFGISA